ncbi:MAG: hypothetical protein JXQ30_13120, partial [Spirochaetes bacterium]|nr:hypothetical protein [Spirochaetota bacterium]
YSMLSVHFPHFQILRLAVRPRKLSRKRRRKLTDFNIPGEILENAEYIELENALIPPDAVHSVYGEHIEPEGTWEVVVRREHPGGAGKIPYNISVMAEEKALLYTIGSFRRIRTVGEEVILSVMLRSLGRPVTKVSVVQADVTRPRYSVDTLFKKYNIKTAARATTDGEEATPFIQKMNKLLTIPNAAKALNEKVEKTVTLIPLWLNQETGAGWIERVKGKRKKGFYAGRFTDTSVPGLYRVGFTIKGYAAGCGTFERVVSRTFIVRKKTPKAGSLKRGGSASKTR